MTPEQHEVYELKQQGKTRAEIAELTGRSFRQVKTLLHQAAQYLKASEGQRQAIAVTGLSHGVARHGWRVVQHEDGSRDSVFWRSEDAEDEPEDIVDRIADRLERIKPATVQPYSGTAREDLLNFLPLFDVHLSMRVGDYGTHDAVQRLINGGGDVLARMPEAETTVIVNGGDFTHQNDTSNLTPQSKHPLPVDSEYDDTTDMAVDVTVALIEMALSRSQTVLYKALRGNHDPNTARILRAALRQRYRNSDRVVIDDDGIDFFALEWGSNMLCAHHGDIKGKTKKDLALAFAAKYPEIWGRTRRRELFTGHLHHIRNEDVSGMLVNQVRAICPADRYSIENLYDAPSEMIGITYRKEGGRYGSVTHDFN